MDSENPCCVEIEIYHMDNPEVLISKNRLELDRLSYVYYPDKEALDAENTYLIKVTINNSTTPQNEISFYMEESRE